MQRKQLRPACVVPTYDKYHCVGAARKIVQLSCGTEVEISDDASVLGIKTSFMSKTHFSTLHSIRNLLGSKQMLVLH